MCFISIAFKSCAVVVADVFAMARRADGACAATAVRYTPHSQGIKTSLAHMLLDLKVLFELGCWGFKQQDVYYSGWLTDVVLVPGASPILGGALASATNHPVRWQQQ